MKHIAAVLLVSLAFALVLSPHVWAVPGDIYIDGKVDLIDLEILTYWWLVTPCDIVDDCEGADLTGPEGGSEGGTEDGPDGIVNMYDFVFVAAHWLEQDM